MTCGYPGGGTANRECARRRSGYQRRVRANPVQIQEYLAGLDFPVSKEDLLRRAQETGAETEVLESLRSLPAEQFSSPVEISEALRDQPS